ncbi:MAG: hypothetical protein U9R79_18640 [Armatimonadota bacterium]|nr:hypothetical protein [Armatimonadota bacterium]
MADEASENAVTWEAADRGASCTMGCFATLLLLIGLGALLWFFAGGAWKLIVSGVSLAAGVGLLLFMRSPMRGRWEITIDPEPEVVRIYGRRRGVVDEREIPFDQIEAIELREITRDVTIGENVPYQLPVFRLVDGEEVALDERMSIRDPDRAEETLARMRKLVHGAGNKHGTGGEEASDTPGHDGASG